MAVLRLLTAPATNDRSPRYMERALAAIHQAHPQEVVTFHYGTTGGRVGLFIEFADHREELATDPIAASYPNCTLAAATLDEWPSDWTTWSARLQLVPELFPILRHAQFEDLLNGTFADPVSGILRAVMPSEGIHCSVAIRIAPAGRRRQRAAQLALRLLDRDFFRRHH